MPPLSTTEYNEYLTNLLRGNRSACTRTVEKLLEHNIPVYELYLGLFQPSLYDVGRLWERNEISVAVEHLATAITESLLTLVYPILFRTERVGKKAVISCVTHEYHQIGAKMAADAFELNGWDSYFLGANTPVSDLIELVDQTQPDIVGLSLAVYSHVPQLNDAIEQLRSTFPGANVLVGGQAFRSDGARMIKRYRGVEYVPSVLELDGMITEATGNGR